MLTMDTQRQIIAQPKTQNKVTTKVCWTDAFLIFLGVYTNAHPQKSQQLAKYLHDIRLGAEIGGSHMMSSSD